MRPARRPEGDGASAGRAGGQVGVGAGEVSAGVVAHLTYRPGWGSLLVSTAFMFWSIWMPSMVTQDAAGVLGTIEGAVRMALMRCALLAKVLVHALVVQLIVPRNSSLQLVCGRPSFSANSAMVSHLEHKAIFHQIRQHVAPLQPDKGC